jgi:hypothetical protein
MTARPLLFSALALAGCGHGAERPVSVAQAETPDWRAVATPADRVRLTGWRASWVRAIARARAGGFGATIDAEGALLQPDAALVDPLPPAGRYRCRMTKVGARQAGFLDYVAYPPFACAVTVEGGVASLTKLTGSQRPVGVMMPGDARHAVFLGTMLLSDERTAQRYGRDPERDMAGRVERIGPQRWRLVLPAPRWESLTDILELVPA